MRYERYDLVQYESLKFLFKFSIKFEVHFYFLDIIKKIYLKFKYVVSLVWFGCTEG